MNPHAQTIGLSGGLVWYAERIFADCRTSCKSCGHSQPARKPSLSDVRKRARKGRDASPFWVPIAPNEFRLIALEGMAGTTGLEPATSAVTGQRSSRLNYVPRDGYVKWWAASDLNTGPSGCKPDALTAELAARTHTSCYPNALRASMQHIAFPIQYNPVLWLARGKSTLTSTTCSFAQSCLPPDILDPVLARTRTRQHFASPAEVLRRIFRFSYRLAMPKNVPSEARLSTRTATLFCLYARTGFHLSQRVLADSLRGAQPKAGFHRLPCYSATSRGF